MGAFEISMVTDEEPGWKDGLQLPPDTQVGRGNTRGEPPGNLPSVCLEGLPDSLPQIASVLGSPFSSTLK